MITSDGISFLYEAINNNLSHGLILVDGSDVQVDIHKTELLDNKIRIFLYADETISGNITRYQIIEKSGKVFMEKNDNIVKDNERGLLLLFEIQVNEQ